MSKEEFERKQAYWEQRNQEKRNRPSQFVSPDDPTAGKRVTLRDVYAKPKQETLQSPRPFNPIGSMKMPPGDKDVEEAKRKYFETH